MVSGFGRRVRWGAAQRSDSRPRVALVAILSVQLSSHFPWVESLGIQVQQMEGEEGVQSGAEGRPACAPSKISTVSTHACLMGE